MAPPRTISANRVKSGYIFSWYPRGKSRLYIFPATEHCFCHIFYIYKKERVSGTVYLFPEHFKIPQVSSSNTITHAEINSHHPSCLCFWRHHALTSDPLIGRTWKTWPHFSMQLHPRRYLRGWNPSWRFPLPLLSFNNLPQADLYQFWGWPSCIQSQKSTPQGHHIGVKITPLTNFLYSIHSSQHHTHHPILHARLFCYQTQTQ